MVEKSKTQIHFVNYEEKKNVEKKQTFTARHICIVRFASIFSNPVSLCIVVVAGTHQRKE